MSKSQKPFRPIRDPFVVQEAAGVSIRDRLGDLTPEDDKVLRLIGTHLGTLAAGDLAVYAQAGFERTSESWAARKQGITAESSSRWAGAITKGTHDQYALARRGQLAHRDKLTDGIRMLTHRLSLPVGEKERRASRAGTGRTVSGFTSPAASTSSDPAWTTSRPTSPLGGCTSCAAGSAWQETATT